MLLVTKLLNLRLTVLCFDLKLQGVCLIYCVERICPTYNEVEEEADSIDSGDGSEGEELVYWAHGYPPIILPSPVEPNCPPIGQVKVGWEQDDVSLVK